MHVRSDALATGEANTVASEDGHHCCLLSPNPVGKGMTYTHSDEEIWMNEQDRMGLYGIDVKILTDCSK